MKHIKKLFTLLLVLLFGLVMTPPVRSQSPNMNNYCYVPPFIATSVPPLVMLVMGRDHKLYYEAYNDASDLDGDGKLDVGYKHSINYYGYFDPYKCYVYTGNWYFKPVRTTQDKYCGGANEWSGNFLNWLTMSRMDVLRKVLYGGFRDDDSLQRTILRATAIPQDAHSWGKWYAGSDTKKLTPFDPPQSGRRHLFCITSLQSDWNSDRRRIRILLNKSNSIEEWASKERPVCDNSLGNPNYEYNIAVQVCDPNVGLESYCKRYPGSDNILGTNDDVYKPIGLFQKYGEPPDRNTKWCSKSLKPCTNDNECNPNTTHGYCVHKVNMYFGLMTGSYVKNLSGGVLRKSIWPISDEIDPQYGTFMHRDANQHGSIIKNTLDRLRIVGFNYGCPYCYNASDGGNCGWITNRPLGEGECRNWGNPIGEMMYEALRYLAGKTSPTSDFVYSGSDAISQLPLVPWYRSSSSSDNVILPPYNLFPICSKPFMIVLSDINNSYDSDSVPGSSFNSFSGDLTNLNVSSLADIISSTENISGSYFIGQSGSLIDYICSAKSMSSLKNVRGLCPEEPTKQGSFYPASVAYYGNKLNNGWRDNFSVQKPSPLKTFAVALASPVPDIAVKVGNSIVRIVPMAKSLSGCLGVKPACWDKCSITITKDSNGNFKNVKITNCQANAYCPTNQIVDFYVDTVNYDSNNNLTYAKFRINFEDVEQGADHDMDAVVEYEIQPVGSNQIKVKLTSTYAAGCIDQVLGFNISGTTEDGAWLVVKDRDANTDGDTPAQIGNIPLTWERTFTVSGNSAGQLKPPLWYAAKWGGFDDVNGNGVPDLQSEWDKDGDGNPDTYFYIVNPLKMERELERAFSEILKRASSGATVATLASRYQTSSVVLQPAFYPEYITQEGKPIRWLGTFRGYWVDSGQNLREDTVMDKILILLGQYRDKVFTFFFDTNKETKVALFDADPNQNPGVCSSAQIKSPIQLRPTLQFDCILASTSKDARKIYFNDNGNLREFKTSERNKIKPAWTLIDNSLTDGQADCVIEYLRGEYDYTWNCTPYVMKKRVFDVSQICYNFAQGSNAPWKMGPIVYSTPTVAGNQALNQKYTHVYNDNTYREYVLSNNYKNRRSVAFVSSNIGMLHFFRVGHLKETGNTWQPIKLVNDPSSNQNNLVEREEFAFIPQNALPYMLWYGREDYCSLNKGYIPIVDYRVEVFDASFDKSDNPDGNKTRDSWNTYLLGTMGVGGKQLGSYSSSVFLLKLTNYLNDNTGNTLPTLMWEIKLDNGALATSFPARIRQGDSNKNGKWYFVLGSGPKDPNADSYDKFLSDPKLYIINARNGSVHTVALSSLLPNNVRAAVGDVMEFDIDNDYKDDVIYFGMYGYQNNGSSWGGIYRIALKTQSGYKELTNISINDIKKVVELDDFKTGNHTPPVFAAVTATKDESGKLWVYINTGLYLSPSHRAFSYKNYIIGVIDECWDNANKYFNSNCSPVRRVELADAKNVSGYINVNGGSCGPSVLNFTQTTTENMCVCGDSGCSMKQAVKSTNALTDFCVLQNNKKGWFYELDVYIAYSRPAVSFGVLMTEYFKPSDDPCMPVGETFISALRHNTGLPPANPPFIAVGNTENSKLKYSISIGYGSPPLGEVFRIIRDSAGNLSVIGQTSTGAIFNVRQQIGGQSGRFVLWIEK